ncbi:hypothetical protein SAMN05421504_106460 [Amycolatopsis xylanica]|uniref:Uncharacterized protein n=1 Tax=Amycolatopsis xylanica TaxID=589385 RepID=A0A1H3M1Z9_9PSEU|nr:hypothetical protein [Amycolatopsis xylanica]SDY70731.1 hypothetical protein SAMN05421504_106460 [Amycolatopsis xylanica]
MRIRNVSVAAAGFLALTAGTAAAAEPTTTPSSTPPAVSAGMKLSTHHGLPGAKLSIRATCVNGGQVSYFRSPALEVTRVGKVEGTPPFIDVVDNTATVLDVEPGRYKVELVCVFAPHSSQVGATAWFTVDSTEKPADPAKPAVPVKPAKQVTKVPSGAPQTGGGGAAA